MKKLSKKTVSENAEILIRKLKEEERYKEINEDDFEQKAKGYFGARKGKRKKTKRA